MDHLDRYLMTSVPVVRNLQINRSQHVRERVEDAISRFDLASLDCYNSISTLSTYWQSDDTGSAEDSSLFLETISKLKTNELEVKTCTRIIAEEEKALHLMKDVNEKASTMTGKRKLFILHYAGHGVAIGIVTGTANPGVSSWVLLGLGYGLENPNPSKTRTPIAGTRVCQIYLFSIFLFIYFYFTCKFRA